MSISLRNTSLAALLTCGILLASSCKKEEESSNSPPTPLPETEVKRGEEACTAYHKRVCRCAESDPSLKEECELAAARPEAFRLNVEMLEAAGLGEAERKAVRLEARKISNACFEADARLPASCSR